MVFGDSHARGRGGAGVAWTSGIARGQTVPAARRVLLQFAVRSCGPRLGAVALRAGARRTRGGGECGRMGAGTAGGRARVWDELRTFLRWLEGAGVSEAHAQRPGLVRPL